MLGPTLSVAISILQAVSPEAEASVVFARAIECAVAYTDSASLDEDTTGRVAREAVTYCESQRRAAVDGLIAAIEGATEVQATQHVEARMRVSAHERVILRLERGDFTFRGSANQSQDSLGLYGPAVRYLLCIRSAIDQTVDSGFFGENWFGRTLSEGKSEAEIALSHLGSSSCPTSSAEYTQAFMSVKNANLDIQDDIQRAWEPSVIVSLAINPYLELTPRP